jgi:large subunit ribosomal protein L35
LGNTFPGTAQEMVRKESRLRDMRRKLEATKILADINDPLVKKKFEDGFGEICYIQ